MQCIAVETEDQEQMGGDYCAEREGAPGWEEACYGADGENEDAKAVEYKQSGEQACAHNLEEDTAALEAELDRFKWDTLQQAIPICQLEYELRALLMNEMI